MRPGDRVLEIGAGLGTYAFFAADAGATAVLAVDGHPVIHVAHTVARLNGYADRVTFVRGWLPEAAPAEPVDVVIFEDFPARLLDARVWRLLRDLRRSTVAPGARFIPAAARVYVAPVESDRLAAELTLDDEITRYGLDWSPAREYVANRPQYLTVPPEALVESGAQLATFRLDQALPGAAAGGEAVIQVHRRARVNGLAYWFDLDLCDGERVSNHPGEIPASWGQVFLPLDPALEVVPGSVLRVQVGVGVHADGAPAWLTWDVSTGDAQRRGHEFAGMPLGLRDLVEASRDGVPQLNAAGRLTADILGLVDGRRTLGEIASLVANHGRVPVPEMEPLVLRHLRGRIDSRGLRSGGG